MAEAKGVGAGERPSSQSPWTEADLQQSIWELPPPAAVVVAARCAFRVLPLAADPEAYGTGEQANTLPLAVEAGALSAVAVAISTLKDARSNGAIARKAGAAAGAAARAAEESGNLLAAKAAAASARAAWAAAESAWIADDTAGRAANDAARTTAWAAIEAAIEATWAIVEAAAGTDSEAAGWHFNKRGAGAIGPPVRYTVGEDIRQLRASISKAKDLAWAVGECLEAPLWPKRVPGWIGFAGKWRTRLADVPLLRPIAERHQRMWDGKFRAAEVWPVVEHWALHAKGMAGPEAGWGAIAPAQADLPGTQDLLGRKALINGLAAMFADPNQGTPMTIGLFGDWGAGKSTVMGLLKKRLCERHPGQFAFATFNAWKYEQTQNLGAGLAQETVRGLTDGLSLGQRAELRAGFAWNEHRSELFWMFANFGLMPVSALGAGLAFISEAPMIGGVAAALATGLGFFGNQMRKALEHPLAEKAETYLKLPEYGKHLGLTPVLHRHLHVLSHYRLKRSETARSESDLDPLPPIEPPPEWLVRLTRFWTQGEELISHWVDPQRTPTVDRNDLNPPERLIVFVDDLDRCRPDGIVKTFEAIRLVMDIPNVIVIVAVDPRIALQAVGNHFVKLGSDNRAPEDIARDYLGKIVQLPIRLSRPADADVKGYIEGELFKDLLDDEGPFPKPPPTPEPPPMPEPAPEPHPGPTPKPPPQPEPPAPPHPPEELEGVKQSEEIAPPPEPTEAQMKETETERDRFTALAHGFHFTNPRQLRRLRNCYRLLKLLHPQREMWKQLMTMLFWQEFVHQWPEDVHQQCETVIRDPDTKYDTIEDQMALGIVKDAGRTLHLRRDLGAGEGYDRVADTVAHFILPRSEGRPPPSGKAAPEAS